MLVIDDDRPMTGLDLLSLDTGTSSTHKIYGIYKIDKKNLTSEHLKNNL